MRDKRNVAIIGAILAGVCSLLFLLVKVTANFIIAYGFSLLGIAALVACVFAMVNRRGSYPWIGALPIQARAYLIVQVILSAVVVLPEQLGVFTLPVLWFLVLHAAIFAVFAIRMVMLHGGAAHIEKREAEVREKTGYLAGLKTELNTLLGNTDDLSVQEKLKKLAEAVRYSDPMSPEEVASLEMKMMTKAGELKAILANGEQAKAVIGEISLLLEERNRRCRDLK